MNHERSWHKAEIKARDIAKNMFKANGVKTIEYENYKCLDMTSTITKFSLNLMTYIVENNEPKEAQRKVQSISNCLSCDLQLYIR